MKQIPFIELRLQHDYYTDGRCPDFTIEPALATQRLLRNHRCVLKTGASRAYVFIAVADDGALLIPLAPDTTFTFQLRLDNPDFALFTDLTAHMAAKARLFTNANGSSETSGPLSLTSRSSRLTSGVWADVDVHVDEQLIDTVRGPAIFQIPFKAKAARWKYYVITDTNGIALRLEDQGPSPIQFSIANRTNLNEQADPSDPVAVQLAARFPDKQRWRFVSDALIPLQQQARKGLLLYIGDDKVPGPLPNPPLRNFAIDPVLNSGGQTEDSLFQIVNLSEH